MSISVPQRGSCTCWNNQTAVGGSEAAPLVLRRMKSAEATLINSTAGRILSRGPTWFFNATIAGDGVNGDGDVYDGTNTNEEKKYHLEALSGTTFVTGIHSPILFHRGVFAVVNASTTFMTVVWRPASLEEIKKGEFIE